MSSPLTPLVELYLGGDWVDITTDVRVDAGIAIQRGRQDEQGGRGPGVLTLAVNNQTGNYSPRNPEGAYYGLLTRNTPIRVSADVDGASGASVRMLGEVAAWPVEWTLSESDVWVSLTCNGIRRRLGQGRGKKPVTRPLDRALAALSGLAGYWPMTDPNGSTQFATAGPAGVEPMAVSETGVAYASDRDSFPSLDPLPVFTAGSARGEFTAFATSTGATAAMLLHVPSGITLPGSATGMVLASLYFTGGSAGRVDLAIVPSTGQLQVALFNSAGTFVAPAIGLVGAILDSPCMVAFTADQNGTAVDLSLQVLALAGTAADNYSATVAATTLGNCTEIQLGPSAPSAAYAPLTGTTVGHLSVKSGTIDLDDYVNALAAFAGELAEDRIERLCGEQGVPFTLVGAHDGESEPMGPQPAATFLALIDECADVDGGILAEDVNALGFTYRPRVDLYNEAPLVALDYAGRHLSVMRPTEDDQNLVNDLIVSRPGGSSVRYVLPESADEPLNSADPPAGVGLYDNAIDVNVATDGQLAGQASWRVHYATVDEPRYPAIGFDLIRATDPFDGDEIDAILTLAEGRPFAVLGPPGFAGAPDTAYEMLLGWKETLYSHVYAFELCARSHNPYQQVGRYDDDGDYLTEEPGSRYSPDALVTNEALDATETAIDVLTLAGPIVTVNAGSYPLDINIGGERITVGGCTGSTNSQTLTSCTRSVNGVVKSHASGVPVRLWQPARYGL